jgi:nucleoside-diphosphate-sugar epimerase
MNHRSIAITGISGYFGQVLLPLLEGDPDIERVIGIDRKPFPNEVPSTKLEFHQLDVRDPGLEKALKDAEVLIHMAFKLWRTPGDDDVDAVNILGSQNVFSIAERLGIRKLIFTSSAVGYGFHPDNPNPLKEEAPLRPNPENYYGKAKAICEENLIEISGRNPEMVITRLRLAAVAGPNAPRKQFEPYTGNTVISILGYDPPAQLLHEEDMASALHLTLKKDLPGVYNAAGDGPRSLREQVEGRGGRVIALPKALLTPLVWLMWRTGKSVAGPEWLTMSCYPFVMSNEKLKMAGWSPKYSTPETYQALVDAFAQDD